MEVEVLVVVLVVVVLLDPCVEDKYKSEPERNGDSLQLAARP